MPETIKVPKPTPPAVLDAMNTVAAHCAAVGYCGVYIGNTGGAIFSELEDWRKPEEIKMATQAQETTSEIISDAEEYLRSRNPTLTPQQLNDRLVGYLASRVRELECQVADAR